MAYRRFQPPFISSRRSCRWPGIGLTLLLSVGSAAALPPIPAAAAEAGDRAATERRSFDIPAGTLTAALSRFPAQADILLSFDPELVAGLTTVGLDGEFTIDEAFERLLQGSGLQARPVSPGTYTLVRPASGDVAADTLPSITVVGRRPVDVGPFRGLQLDREQIPANLQGATGEEIRRSHATSLTDFMNHSMQSVTVNDYQGNPYQADVQFRGFTASPQIGTPQGLSVFVDGIRVNEPFGDVVNWDMIPLNAISTFDVFPGSTPLYGRNTLGGALSIRTRNGFDDRGVEASLLGGSWGRVQGQLAAGGNVGALGGFVALTGFHEDGWRDDSPSDVKQGLGKLTLRNERLELNGSLLLSGNDLIGNGLLPRELYDQRPETVFTSPDETRNTLRQFSLDGLYSISETFSISGQAYRRESQRRGLNGDIYRDFDDMESGSSEQWVRGNTLPLCQYLDADQNGLPDSNTPLNNPTNAAGVCDAREFALPVGGFVPRNGRFVAGSDPAAYTNDGPGVIAGTPIGTLNRTVLDQEIWGGSMQFNWNLQRHRLMVGASFDSESADYLSTSRLADIDTGHQVVPFPTDRLSDPLYLGGQRFPAAYDDIQNNAFDGTSTTSSGYFSETFSPTDALHLTFAGRLNHTYVENNLKTRRLSGLFNLANTLGQIKPWIYPLDTILCPSADPASCPAAPNTSSSVIANRLLPDPPPRFDGSDDTDLAGNQEKHHFSSFNPFLGVTFQPRDDVTLYANWSQGTRTPSVVELGCAFDPTPVPLNADDPDGAQAPRSLVDTRYGSCTLPTTLSGDPELAQIFGRSFEFGARGTLPNGWQWNASLFRTNLYDDIYFVAVTQERSFFDTIDRTRRQGIELGLSGNAGRMDFRINYGLTEATFESPFHMFGLSNSSADFDINQGVLPGVLYPLEPFLNPDGSASIQTGTIAQPEHVNRYGFSTYHFFKVEPGDRMPGVPLHNLNATVDFRVTPRWTIGLNMIGRSSSFVRGNENNDHQPGPAGDEKSALSGDIAFDPDTGEPIGVIFSETIPFRRRQPFRQSGTVPGYFLFNLETRFELDRGFTLFANINNLFDREYFTAGRLDVNPFSPSIYGAIGPSGWNYNSKDWQNTLYVAPGAPRAFWLGLEYRF